MASEPGLEILCEEIRIALLALRRLDPWLMEREVRITLAKSRVPFGDQDRPAGDFILEAVAGPRAET